MANIIRTVIAFRRAHTDEWLANKHVVPAAGEPCFDLDLNTLKIGNGVDSYEKLEPIGGVKLEISADGKSVVLEDGIFKLAGFDAAAVGAQPRKSADGGIEWVVPSTDGIEELKSTVSTIQSSMTVLEKTVTNIKEIVTPSGDDSVPLLTRIETLEEKMDGEAEGSVDAKIDAKINEFANQITDDGTVNTLKELINYVANHGGDLETVVSDIITLQGLVGEGSVDDRITAAVANKVDAEEGKSLINDILIAKLEAIEESAQANKVEAIYVGETLLEIVNKVATIPVGAGLKASDEITIAEDGTLGIGTISWGKIVQVGGENVVFDGGGAAD